MRYINTFLKSKLLLSKQRRFYKKNSISLKLITSLIFSLMLSACGGGDSNKDQTSQLSNSKNSNSNGETTNSAPVLTMPKEITKIDENTIQYFTLSASDANNDTITYSARTSNTALVAKIDGQTLALSAKEVNANTNVTLTVTASDGKASDSETMTIMVIDMLPIESNTAPSIQLEPSASIKVNETKEIQVTILDDKDTQFEPIITIAQPNIATLKKTRNGFEITGVAQGTTSINFSVTDSGNLTTNAILNITVTPPNDVPILTLIGETDGIVTLKDNHETEFAFEIKDDDNAIHDVSISDFREVKGSFDIIKQYKLTSSSIKLTVNALPQDVDEFLLGFTFKVSDGNDATEREVLFKIVSPKSDIPTFEYSRSDANFIYLNHNAETRVTYKVLDDDPSQFSFTKVTHWYGDQDSYTIELDQENSTMIITTTNSNIKDTLGISLYWQDEGNSGIENLEFYIMSPISEYELEAQEVFNNTLLYEASVKEYHYLGKFYVEVAENTGLITSQQAEDYKQSLETAETQSYVLLKQYQSIFFIYVFSGDFKDEGFRGSYKTVVTDIMEDLTGEGAYAITIINELANISHNRLPKVTFSSTVHEYDPNNHYFSKLKGNLDYGAYDKSGKWTFSPEFKFLDAVVAKTLEKQKKKLVDLTRLFQEKASESQRVN